MEKSIKNTKLNDNLTLSECKDGFWLYDKSRGMNLSMKANSEQAAFVESLAYYADRLTRVEKQLAEITSKVENFVSQFINQEVNWYEKFK